jgi:hypothetical protein
LNKISRWFGLHPYWALTLAVLAALAVIWGTYRLARHCCDHPMLAALAALFTPVFLVSSLTVMCDVLMLAFWVWAVVWWVEGMERDDFGRLAVSGRRNIRRLRRGFTDIPKWPPFWRRWRSRAAARPWRLFLRPCSGGCHRWRYWAA